MLMRKNLRGNEKLFLNSILSALLRFILNLISFICPFNTCLDSDFVYHVKKQNRATKSGCKSLMAVYLTHFSGFSGISIDILDSQDIKNNELTAKLNRDFHLYLVCSPDFYS